MKTFTNVIENISIALGVSLGIAQIETILGIILLVFQIILILFKCGRSIYLHVKNKDVDGIQNDLEDTIKQIEHLKDKDGKQ